MIEMQTLTSPESLFDSIHERVSVFTDEIFAPRIDLWNKPLMSELFHLLDEIILELDEWLQTYLHLVRTNVLPRIPYDENKPFSEVINLKASYKPISEFYRYRVEHYDDLLKEQPPDVQAKYAAWREPLTHL